MRKISGFVIPALALALAAGCTAEVEDSGSLPDVDVQGGEAPEIDVNPADVRISTDTQVVETPDIDVVPRDP